MPVRRFHFRIRLALQTTFEAPAPIAGALITHDDNAITASNGVSLDVDAMTGESEEFDLVAVNANPAPKRHQFAKLGDWFVKWARQGTVLAGIGTAISCLPDWALLNGYRATVHYEHGGAVQEPFLRLVFEEALYVIDRDRITCCASTAATDLALRPIRSHHRMDLTSASAFYLFKERYRMGNEAQVKRELEPIGYAMPPKLRDAVIRM